MVRKRGRPEGKHEEDPPDLDVEQSHDDRVPQLVEDEDEADG